MLLPLIVVLSIQQLAFGFKAKELIVNDVDTALRWKDSVQDFDSIFWSQREKFISVLNQFLNSDSSKLINKKCLKSLNVVSKGLKERQLWSYKCKRDQQFEHF